MYWKDENKEKEAGDGPFFKKNNKLMSIPNTKVHSKPNRSLTLRYKYRQLRLLKASKLDRWTLNGPKTRYEVFIGT